MPEGLEAEIWREALTATVGRRIEHVWVDERVADPDLADLLTGSTVTAVRRLGKVVLVDSTAATIGLHFGMTGRVVVDGRAPIERLDYASDRDRPEWDRLRVTMSAGASGGRRGGGVAGAAGAAGVPAIRMNDPRRLGRISVDPDLSHLGPDVFELTARVLGERLTGRRLAVKVALLDQTIVAGLGNMCADEVLWWAGIDPRRPAGSLSAAEVGGLARAIRRRLPIMLRRGGSNTGVIDPAVRAARPPCPRDGTDLRRTTIGGRTAVWCPEHQR